MVWNLTLKKQTVRNYVGCYKVWMFCSLIGLVACGNESALKTMGDFELAERQAECIDREPTAPGRVQACKNINKECERRKKDLGLYVCRFQ